MEAADDTKPEIGDAFLFVLQLVIDEVVGEDDAFGGETLAQFRVAITGQGLLRGHAHRQVELGRQLEIDLQIPRIVLERAHVRVQVRDIHTRRQCALDLRAALDQGLVRRGVGVHFRHFAP